MERLCERPGCSDGASVAYGMRPADLVFWLDVLTTVADASHGVLCRRHADSMIVPRSWTLDDMRDPDLRLFRPPALTEADPAARRTPSRPHRAEQLELGIDGEQVSEGSETADGSAPETEAAASEEPADAGEAETWTPSFNIEDDLDGLLAARSPLLARAFGGTDRPRSS